MQEAVLPLALLLVLVTLSSLSSASSSEDFTARTSFLHSQLLTGSSCGYSNIDVSPLSSSSTDYVLNQTNYQYLFNPCSVAREPNCNSRGGSLCQYTLTQTFTHVIADWTNPAWSFINNNPSQGIQAQFQNGDLCFFNGSAQPRSVCLCLGIFPFLFFSPLLCFGSVLYC
jgi:hypothetical protein